MKNNFNSEENAQKIIIENLEKKYDQKFIHIENTEENIEKYPIKKTYTGYFAPEDKPENIFFVWISDKDNMRDNFAQYYILDDVKQKIAPLIDTNETTLEEITLEPKGTTKIVDSNISLEEYDNEFNPTYIITVCLKKNLSENDNVAIINKIMNSLYSNMTNFRIRVHFENETQSYFSDAFYSDMNQIPDNILEHIKERIRDQEENNELLQKDE